jgi:hypothetical protein
MAMRAKQVVLAVVLLITIVFSPPDLPSCGGPIFNEAVFTEKAHPPKVSDYVRGHLDVIHPTYDRWGLFIAYRYLSAKPLSVEEQKGLLNNPAPENGSEEVQIGQSWGTVALKRWLDMRASIPNIGALPGIEMDRKVKDSEWQTFANCTNDAFQNAATTLEARIKAFGVGHPGIKSWIQAQDAVFSNCSGGKTIPDAPADPLPEIFKQDRAYQIAAANFYCMQYDKAADQFRAIAADVKSPWSSIAPYLVARCLIRKSSVTAEYGEFDRQTLAAAERELTAILQNERNRAIHPPAKKLANYVALRLHPVEQLNHLSTKLQQSSAANDFRQDLTDYLYLLDHVGSRTLTQEVASASSDMTDWILTFQGEVKSKEANLRHSLERWKLTKNDAWMISSIAQIDAAHPESAAMIADALKPAKNSPGYATAQYHRIRLIRESGKNDQARTALDELLPGLRASLSNSSLNLFLAQRMKVARNLEDFIQFAPRFPSNVWYGFREEGSKNKSEPTALLDADSARVLNQGLPISMLYRTAVSKSLPLNLKQQLLRTTWVRAILLSDQAVALGLAPELELAFPELKADLQIWLAAQEMESKRFAAAMLMLHFPGMSPFIRSGAPERTQLSGIDNYRENWWCGLSVEGDLDLPSFERYNMSRDWGFPSKYKNPQKRPEPTDLPEFLNASEKTQFSGEWNKLNGAETAPNFLGKTVLSWASKHPKDTRIPEALYLVVRAGHYGCSDAATWRYSRDAFQLLHKQYEESAWAKMTKYWYR